MAKQITMESSFKDIYSFLFPTVPLIKSLSRFRLACSDPRNDNKAHINFITNERDLLALGGFLHVIFDMNEELKVSFDVFCLFIIYCARQNGAQCAAVGYGNWNQDMRAGVEISLTHKHLFGVNGKFSMDARWRL